MYFEVELIHGTDSNHKLNTKEIIKHTIDGFFQSQRYNQFYAIF